MTKKIFAISTLLLVLVVAFALIYNFIFKKQSGGPTAASSKTAASGEGKVASSGTNPSGNGTAKQNNPAPNGASVSQGNSPIAAVSDEPIFGATLSADGQFLYWFLAGNGQLNQAGLDGKLEKVLSTEQYQNLNKVIWNKQKNRAIIKTASVPGKPKYLIYDLLTKKVSVLKENTDSVAWSNLGDKIIYKYYDPKTKKRTVSVSDPDGKNWKDLADFDYRYTDIAAVPNSAQISFWPSPDTNLSTLVNTIPFGGGEKKEILKDRFGADLLWSPDGSSAAVSYTDETGGHKTDLATMDSAGDHFQSLGFPTFASKCVWSADSKYLYCALPGEVPDSAVLPNDWQEGKTKTADTFWKIEISSGKKTRLVEADQISGSYDALNPFLSKDEKTLFFVNKADGKLYKLGF